MEYLIAGLIVILLVFFSDVRKTHNHYVLVGRNKTKTIYHVVLKSDHKQYLAGGKTKRVMLFTKWFISEKIEKEKACFYTYSFENKSYAKVLTNSSNSYLTTEFDDVKDNNIESLKVMV